MPMVAWYMLSKESYMKRVINDVLPTAQGVSLGADEGDSLAGCGYTTLFAEKHQPVRDRVSMGGFWVRRGRRQLT